MPDYPTLHWRLVQCKTTYQACQYNKMIISVYIFWLIFILPVNSQSTQIIIDKVLKSSTVKQVCILGQNYTDVDLEALSLISLEEQLPLFVGFNNGLFDRWSENCNLKKNGLAILQNLDLSSIKTILNEASQRELAQNLWIVLNTDTADLKKVESIFHLNKRKFGIQIVILFMQPSIIPAGTSHIFVTQVLGTATTKVKFVDHGDLNDLNLTKVIGDTRSNNDFNGLEFKVNYSEYAPYCIIEDIDEQKLIGAFPDSLKIVAAKLNLTIIIQKPLPENKGTWAKQ
jgi:hypothetical protein